MKTAVLFLVSLFLVPSSHAEPELSTRTSMEALRKSKIPMLSLNKQTFEESFAEIEVEWRKQHPDLSFPVALADYRNESEHASGPLITLNLKEVPFVEALGYLGESSKRRLVERPGILQIEDVGGIVEDWYVEIHPLEPGTAKKLGLGESPTSADVAAAYARYGVKLEAWMEIRLSGNKLILMANKPQHQQIAGINLLLEQGFTITKEK